MIEIVHRLSGSAGTFGYLEISRAAEALELAIDRNDPFDEELALLLTLIDGLQDV